LARAGHPPSPERVDRVLRTLGRQCSAHESKLGRWLLQGFRLGVHRLHGYGSFREYAARVFGFTGRATEERLRTAEALESLPVLAKAFDEGAVTYSVVRELTRVVTARASQTIPPRVRRAVLRRHHNRCAAPGCTHGAFVHVHHIELRSEGGTHDPDRMLPLCSAHHRAVHDGRLAVTGTYSKGFTFTHADGTRYGAPQPDPGRLKVLAEVFQILVSMGFRQREARQMIERSAPTWGPKPVSRRRCAPCCRKRG
jgi:hypothetical protein